MQRHTLRIALGVSVALAAGGAWLASLWFQPAPSDAVVERREAPASELQATVHPVALPAQRSPIEAPEAEHATSSLEVARAASRQRPRDFPDPAPGSRGVVPHPLDGQRSRLQEQLRLFAEVDAALGDADFVTARRLLAEHDRSFDEQEAWSDLREGYQLIADCQQSPSTETRARGARFVAEQRGSTLRRKVRRACQ